MNSILVVNSRSLIDRANKYTDEIKKKGSLVQILGKIVKLRDSDKQFLAESNISNQKLEAVTASEEVHILWDGEELDTIFICGIAFALGKTIKMIHSGLSGVRRHLWDCKEKRTYDKG